MPRAGAQGILSPMSTPLDFFWLGFEGNQPCGELERWISKRLPSGIVLFGRNIPERAAELRSFLGWFHELYAKRNEPPPFIAIDHEGGKVHRLGGLATRFPPWGRIAPLGEAMVAKVARVQCAELRGLGFNTLFGPVLDVADPRAFRKNALENRTFSGDTNTVALLGTAFLRASAETGILACPKHFPGYGSVTVDPHLDLPHASVSREEWERVHAAPFRDLHDDVAPFMMLAHLRHSVFAAGEGPTSLDPEVVAWLRDEAGYRGLVIPDDLCMAAVTSSTGWPEVGPAGLEAGLDLLLLCHADQPHAGAVDQVIEAVRRWKPSAAVQGRLDLASGRIRQLREQLPKPPARCRPAKPGSTLLREIEARLGDQ